VFRTSLEFEWRRLSVVELRERLGAVQQGRDEPLAPLLECASQLVRSAIHDLRTPLAAIAMAAQGAKRRPECQVAARGLDRILRSCERMDFMLKELAVVGRLGLASTNPEQAPVECSRLVPEALARLSDRLDMRRVHVALAEQLPTVRVDPKQFEHILEIALTTVLSSSGDDGEAALEASAGESWVDIAVRVERPPAVPERSSAGAPGLGVGGSGREALSSQAQVLRLLLLRVLVEANAGTVCVDGVPETPAGLRLRLVRAITDADQLV
jgi:signal transduction histidine kinase